MATDSPAPDRQDTTFDELSDRTAAAAAVAPALDDASAGERAERLRAIADDLDAAGDRLVELAHDETALGSPRLPGELARTTGQLRMFADVVLEGSFLEAVIDTADPDASPPRPDIRRLLHAIGPVAVFSASNFPFAFSVAGGDTASALAAGCPVIVKIHPGHPRLSHAVADVVAGALDRVGAPDGTFACVAGVETGKQLVTESHIRAVGFTGSLAGGRALFDLATGRPDPIPFYGELGSINPVIITESAARERGAGIAAELVDSFTMGTGQFCTKPGIVLVPQDSDVVEQVAQAVSPEPAEMLNERIAEGFHRGVGELGDNPRVRVVAGPTEQQGASGTPVVFATTVDDLVADTDALVTERFGPACLLVEYRGDEQLRAALDVLPASLAISVHAEADEQAAIAALLRAIRERAGRVIWNGWPTGVAVTWSMHHGGPWPATTAPLHTSVGATAIRRWLRPVAYQDWPAELLPAALRDDNPLGIPRRIDGRLRV